MVYINRHCQNYPPPKDGFGGAKCVCEKCVKERQQAAGEESNSTLLLNAKELDRVRQWFNAIYDTNPRFLDNEDFAVVRKIYAKLSYPIPDNYL